METGVGLLYYGRILILYYGRILILALVPENFLGYNKAYFSINISDTIVLFTGIWHVFPPNDSKSCVNILVDIWYLYQIPVTIVEDMCFFQMKNKKT